MSLRRREFLGAMAAGALLSGCAGESEHLAALRLAAGQEPVPDAFAGFTPAAGA